MNVKINSVNIKINDQLEEFVNTKVKNLVKFFEDIIGAEVFLKKQNTQAADNKTAKIIVEIPGNDLFAEKQAKTFEEAIDATVEALRRQIKKHKEKMRGK